MDTHPVNEEFLRLIQDNKGIIIKICQLYCHDKNDREDLAQEIIYQLWKSARRFNEGYKFSTWMYRVALNVAISFYRKERKSNPVVSVADIHIDIEDTPAPDNEMDERIRQLQQFIAGLKELDRALMLLYLEEKSYREIAEILGISETNVATKISRIKERLKQHFHNTQPVK